jgi:replication-associated recombination protein RarA
MAYHLTTVNHFDFFEVASALQKEIRRGHEEEAMYWALELAGTYDTFLWRRLVIIASEDIGPADSTVAPLMETLQWQYMDVKKASKRPSERIILAHAIIALCRAPKSRIADDLAALVSHQRDNEGLRREIPEYALDQHTARGKQRRRSWQHWADEGCVLANEVEGLNCYRERTMQMWLQYGKLPDRAPGQGRRKTEQTPLFDEDVG